MSGEGPQMSTTIKARCDTDAEVEVQPEDFTLLICTNDPSMTRYRFVCPSCGVEINRLIADPQMCCYLMDAGVNCEEWAYVHPSIAGSVPVQEPVTYDELLDFHQALDRWDGSVPTTGA